MISKLKQIYRIIFPIKVKTQEYFEKQIAWLPDYQYYSKDALLANIMVYVVTKTFNTATWIYYGRREEGGRFFPKDFKKIEIPTAAAVFPAEMSEWPPRSYVDRMFNITQWTEMPSGGHFAALEEPELLVNDLVKFSRTVR